MAALKPSIPEPVEKLTAALDEALALLKDTAYSWEPLPAGNETPASLLDQCLALCTQHEAAAPEPIRTVHHFACSGGTLISKCIATMPNTQMLSEVDPLSPLGQSKKQRFAPTDMVTLMRQSTRGVSQDLIVELFLNELDIVYSEAVRVGQRLILRDHAHSHFCAGAEIPERPSFRQMIAGRFPTLSIVTVRHPLDSYLSLESNGWIHFTPKTFDEYCRRYIAFLHHYEKVPIVRYEDFVAAPAETMSAVCKLLNIPFTGQFSDLIGAIKMTGDSGRNGDDIASRPRRPVPGPLAEELETSRNYQTLRQMLRYDEPQLK